MDFITNINGLDSKITTLEEEIKTKVNIPALLLNHLRWSTTSLGGLFLSYYSNASIKGAYKLNAKTSISIMVNVTERFGKYVDDTATLEVSQVRNLKFTQVKKPQPVDKIINKLQKWIDANYTTLIEAIEE